MDGSRIEAQLISIRASESNHRNSVESIWRNEQENRIANRPALVEKIDRVTCKSMLIVESSIYGQSSSRRPYAIRNSVVFLCVAN